MAKKSKPIMSSPRNGFKNGGQVKKGGKCK